MCEGNKVLRHISSTADFESVAPDIENTDWLIIYTEVLDEESVTTFFGVILCIIIHFVLYSYTQKLFLCKVIQH